MVVSVQRTAPNVTQLVRYAGRVFAARWVAGRLVVRVLRGDR